MVWAEMVNWTSAARVEIVAGYRAGGSVDALAKTQGRSVASVRAALARMGVKRVPGPVEHERRSLAARKSPRTVKIPEHVDPLVRRLFVLMRKERLSVREIAERSGVSGGAVWKWKNRSAPVLPLFQAVLGVLGFELKIVRKAAYGTEEGIEK